VNPISIVRGIFPTIVVASGIFPIKKVCYILEIHDNETQI
jgi:hypothetical protein